MSAQSHPNSAPWEGLRVSVALEGTVLAVEEPNLRVRLNGGFGEVLVAPSRCIGIPDWKADDDFEQACLAAEEGNDDA